MFKALDATTSAWIASVLFGRYFDITGADLSVITTSTNDDVTVYQDNNGTRYVLAFGDDFDATNAVVRRTLPHNAREITDYNGERKIYVLAAISSAAAISSSATLDIRNRSDNLILHIEQRCIFIGNQTETKGGEDNV